MYFAQIALAVASFMVFVKGESDEKSGDDNISLGENDKENKRVVENPTFVALIDTVFTDGQKKTCTGSIIHEMVVITAAHCFTSITKKIWPELTGSFVVIGNKLMFENGYEQYFPIERVVIHPKFKGWTADLALVFTYASMTNDKPGTIIPLAGEKTTIHVDFNLTVLTWGHTALDEPSDHGNSCFSDDDDQTGAECGPDILRHRPEEPEKTEVEIQREPEPSVITTVKEPRKLYGDAIYQRPVSYKIRKQEHKKRSQRQRTKHKYERSRRNETARKPRAEQSTKIVSRYLKSGEQGRDADEEEPKKTEFEIEPEPEPRVITTVSALKELRKLYSDADYQRPVSHKIRKQEHKKRSRHRTKHQFKKSRRNETARKPKAEQSTKIVSRYLKSGEQGRDADENLEEVSEENFPNQPLTVLPRLFSFKSSFDNWRRSQGVQQNQMFVENFSFVSLQQCKLLVEKTTPDEFDITKYNDAVCYSSKGLYITDADSGAPAIRKGKLVAVTVGGVKYDSERAAIGMKMSCYCSWIDDNLPEGAPKLNCCKNCCEVKHKETVTPNGYRFRNKYLL